ncbi:uncharacterized protein V1510DRAFT_412725 [Dipodascopsis tothii]|uniref:uncharacterized protein n=1 Tax=Dipodascopsis tothii TaxID=44089 RepID=UPI0034CD6347
MRSRILGSAKYKGMCFGPASSSLLHSIKTNKSLKHFTMKYSAALIFAAAIAGKAAAANYDTYPSVAQTASVNGLADPIDAELPSCAVACFAISTDNTPCPYWDTGCLCVMPQWTGEVAECLISACGGSEIASATSLANSACVSAGISLYLPASAIAELSSAEANAVASTSATTTAEVATSTSSSSTPAATSTTSSSSAAETSSAASSSPISTASFFTSTTASPVSSNTTYNSSTVTASIATVTASSAGTLKISAAIFGAVAFAAFAGAF